MHAHLPAAIVLIGVLIVDFVWLYANRGSYNRLVAGVQGRPITMNLYGAIASYMCVVGLLVAFVFPMVRKAIRKQKAWKGPARAALLGLLVYGVFNATNVGIFRSYDVGVAFMDTLWGGALFGVAALAYSLLLAI